MQANDDTFTSVPAVVAIPVRDEVERIADCLLALSAQEQAVPGVLLLVNDTRDATMQTVEDLRPALACPVVVIEHWFGPEGGSAGAARRLAMDAADRLAPAGIPLLTTDADGRAAPDWVACNLLHLREVDAVFGMAEMDAIEGARIPPALHRADAAEGAFGLLLDEIASILDPDGDDPWPRHTEHSGASIGVRRIAFREAGGIPAVSLGEDRAFGAALRRIDARIRHARDVRVVVSGRILGRAVGGMADTIRRRLVAPDTMVDAAMEPVADRVRRLWLRRAARAAYLAGDAGGFAAVAEACGLCRAEALLLMTCGWFGEAWAVIETGLPARRVPVSELAAETAEARRTLGGLQIGRLVPAV